jgi:hypothetical protein
MALFQHSLGRTEGNHNKSVMIVSVSDKIKFEHLWIKVTSITVWTYIFSFQLWDSGLVSNHTAEPTFLKQSLYFVSIWILPKFSSKDSGNFSFSYTSSWDFLCHFEQIFFGARSISRYLCSYLFVFLLFKSQSGSIFPHFGNFFPTHGPVPDCFISLDL